MKLFVTVGTTRFDELIREVCKESVLRAFVDYGYSDITIQIGTGEFEPPSTHNVSGLNLNFFRKKASIREDMEQADLIVSHAGAGSLFESLRMKKKVITVANESLMGNHQTELANALDHDGNVVSATILNFENTILDKVLFHKRLSALKPLQPSNAEAFARVVDEEMGL